MHRSRLYIWPIRAPNVVQKHPPPARSSPRNSTCVQFRGRAQSDHARNTTRVVFRGVQRSGQLRNCTRVLFRWGTLPGGRDRTQVLHQWYTVGISNSVVERSCTVYQTSAVFDICSVVVQRIRNASDIYTAYERDVVDGGRSHDSSQNLAAVSYIPASRWR